MDRLAVRTVSSSSERPRRRSIVPSPRWWLSVAVFAVLMGAWEVAGRTIPGGELLLPPPSAVWEALVHGFSTGVLVKHFSYTLLEIMLGFGVGAGVGLLLGSAIALVPLLDHLLYPYIVGFQTMPKIAIAPILVVWLGFGIWSKIVIGAMVCFFPVVANVIEGLRSADAQKIEFMHTCCASRWQIFWMVKVPSALPFVFTGLDIGIVLSVLGAIVGEFVGAKVGLGYLIVQYNFELRMADVFAALVLLSLTGYVLHVAMNYLHRRLVFWNQQTDHVVGA